MLSPLARCRGDAIGRGDLLQWKRGVLLHLELIAMPVKVRCSECEKVLNAPDHAQGEGDQMSGLRVGRARADREAGQESGRTAPQ